MIGLKKKKETHVENGTKKRKTHVRLRKREQERETPVRTLSSLLPNNYHLKTLNLTPL